MLLSSDGDGDEGAEEGLLKSPKRTEVAAEVSSFAFSFFTNPTNEAIFFSPLQPLLDL